MNSKSIPTNGIATSISRCMHRIMPATLAISLAMTTGTAFCGTPFAGKMPEMTITDAAKTNTPPTPVLKYALNGNTVTVDASGSTDTDGSIVQYKWDFGDGGKATGIKAEHQYAALGNYQLTLTVVDNAGGVGIAQQQLDPNILFYWSVDSLPPPPHAPTQITSDIGNVPITQVADAATSEPGFKGNCMHQTGSNQYYTIPMTTVPAAKGTIRMYVRHDVLDETTRYFFTTGIGLDNVVKPNSLSAYTIGPTIYFYIRDAAGTLHSINTGRLGVWQTGIWYLYEFSWNTSTLGLSSLVVKRDGVILAQSNTRWTSGILSWTNQSLFFGYVNPIGSFDEIYITN